MPKILSKEDLIKRIRSKMKKIKTLQRSKKKDEITLKEKFGVSFKGSKKEINKSEKENNFLHIYFSNLELDKIKEKKGKYEIKEFIKYIIKKSIF